MNFEWNVFPVAEHSAEWLIFLAIASLKGMLVLAAAAMLNFILRSRATAATRHLLWCVALGGLLALPLLSSALNVWKVQVLPVVVLPVTEASDEAPSRGIDAVSPSRVQLRNDRVESLGLDNVNSSGTVVAPAVLDPASNVPPIQKRVTALQRSLASLHWTTWMLMMWLIGVLLILARLLIGMIGAKWIAHQATFFLDDAWISLMNNLSAELGMRRRVRLLRSQRVAMPVTWGYLRPVVLLPAEADEWPTERRRIVLLHELAHVKRGDYITQILAQAVCAVYWFNPLVWYAAKRLRIERERACDNYVLAAGTKASEYADYLLKAARSLHATGSIEWSRVATIAMARRSQLEGRLLAILDPRPLECRKMPRAVPVAVAAIVCFLTLSLAAIQPATRAMHEIPDQSIEVDAQSFVEAEQTLDAAAAAEEASSLEIEVHATEAADQQGLKEKSKQTQSIEEADQEAEHFIDTSVDISIATMQSKQDRDDQEATAPKPNPEPQVHTVVRPDVRVTPVVVDSIIGKIVHSTIERVTSRISEHAASRVDEELRRRLKLIELKGRVDPQAGVNPRPIQENKGDGKSVDFIDEMAAAGLTNLSIDQLIKLKTHGVTGAFVKSLRALGYSNLSVDELAKLRIHNVTPAYIEGMRAAGYTALSSDDLARLRIHNVTPDYVKALKAAGFANLSVEEITDLRIHGVTPEFINGMRAAGFNNLTTEQLKQLRMHNVTPEFIRAVRSRGFNDLSLDQIIKLKMFNIINVSTDK